MKPVFAALVLLALPLVVCGSVAAEQPAQHQGATSEPQHQNAADSAAKATPEDQLAETSNEAAGHGEAHDPHAQFKYSSSVKFLARKTGLSPDTIYWISVVLNFAIVAGAIAIVWKKKMPGAFRNRTSAIQKGLEEARRASEEARRRLGDIESRLSRLDAEIAGIESNAELQARQEEARLRAAVEEERQKILHSAEQEIARAANNARRELTAYAAELSVNLAEKKIKVDAATDAEILRDFVDQLGTDGARRRSS